MSLFFSCTKHWDPSKQIVTRKFLNEEAMDMLFALVEQKQ